jgi:hypothetical protein
MQSASSPSPVNPCAHGSHVLDFPVGRDAVTPLVLEESGRVAFGRMLRDARVRRGISLTEISDRTKIPDRHFASLERGDISRWPGGMYRRAMVRAYCTCVGLQTEEVVQGFMQVFGETGLAHDVSDGPAAPVRPPAISGAMMAMVAIVVVAIAISVARAVIAVRPSTSEQLRREAPVEKPQSSGVPAETSPIADATTTAADVEGELVVSSDPAGAQVTVNGIGWGITPLRIQHLPLGYKRLRLTQSGYLGEERAVSLDATRHVRRFHVRLHPSE